MTALRALLRSMLPVGGTIWTGRIVGASMTVAALSPGSAGALAVGDPVLGTGVAPGTYIVAQVSGTTGGAGVYTIAPSQNVAAAPVPVIRMYSGVQVVQAQVNRVPEMSTDDFVLLTPKLRQRLETNVLTSADVTLTGVITSNVLTASNVALGALGAGQYLLGPNIPAGIRILRQLTGTAGGDGTYALSPCSNVASQDMAAGGMIHLQPTEVTVQVDVHGPNSANNTQTIATLFRDEYSTALLPATIKPLFVEDRGQQPFINGEQQWETRWVLDLHLQVNAEIRTPQEFADELEATLYDVDNVYPA